jgi:hypothetical protein
MKVGIRAPEVMRFFKESQEQPEKAFEMIRYKGKCWTISDPNDECRTHPFSGKSTL